MDAIDAKPAGQATGSMTAHRPAGSAIYACSCGFATDDQEWLDGHPFSYPGHDERNQPSGRP